MEKETKVKIGVLVLFTIFALLQLYPLSTNLKDSVHDPGDPILISWIIGWMQHQLIHDPGNLFEGNVLYPHKKTLAFTEHFFPQAVISFPIALIFNNPILTHNVLLFFSYVFAAFAMFLLVGHLTKNNTAAFVSGIIFAFSAFHMSQTPHLQLLSSGLIPLALLYLHKFFETSSQKHALLFWLFFTVQVLACLYYGLFFISILAVLIPLFLVIYWRKIKLPGLLKLAWPFIVSGGILLFFSLPYLTLFKETGFKRIVASGADLENYFAPMNRSVLFRWMTPLGASERHLFPGFLALFLMFLFVFIKVRSVKISPRILRRAGLILGIVLFILAVILAIKGNVIFNLVLIKISLVQLISIPLCVVTLILCYWIVIFIINNLKLSEQNREENWYFLIYAVLAVWALFLSFGRAFSFFGQFSIDLPFPFAWLYNNVPGFKGIRVAARYAVFVLLSVSVLAGFGMKYWLRLFKKNSIKTYLAVAMVIVLNLEYLAIPHNMKTIPVGKDIPPTYTWIKDNAQDHPIIEIPFFGALGRNSLYMYFSLFHKKNIVNGFSGFLPPAIKYFEGLFKAFPSDTSLDVLKSLKVKYVVLHMKMWKKEFADIVLRRIKEYFPDDLKIIERFDYTFQKENFLSDKFGEDIIVEVNLDKEVDKPVLRSNLTKIPKKEWTIRSNAMPNLLMYLKDNDLKSRWTTQRPRKKGDFIELEFDEPRDVAKISLHLGPFPTDFGINFSVETSQDGEEWRKQPQSYYPKELVESLISFDKDPVQDIVLNAGKVKFIRIIQIHQTRTYWWSVAELEIYEAN